MKKRSKIKTGRNLRIKELEHAIKLMKWCMDVCLSTKSEPIKKMRIESFYHYYDRVMNTDEAKLHHYKGWWEE